MINYRQDVLCVRVLTEALRRGKGDSLTPKEDDHKFFQRLDDVGSRP